MDVAEFAEKIQSKEDFVFFLKLLREDFHEKPLEWENDNLDNFLEALEAYSNDSRVTEASWKNFADFLIGASIYE